MSTLGDTTAGVALVLSLAACGGACSSSDQVSERTPAPQVTSPTTLSPSRVGAGGATRLTWRFEAAGSLMRPVASAALYTVPLDPPAELVARLASALGVRSSLRRTTTGW